MTVVTIEQLKEAAGKAGIAKFFLLGDANVARKDMVLVGSDFIERLHEQLVKQGEAK